VPGADNIIAVPYVDAKREEVTDASIIGAAPELADAGPRSAHPTANRPPADSQPTPS
jgi:hypothetical protein